MRRVIKLRGLDKELNLSKVVTINLESSSSSEFIYIEKMKDGNWRLTYTQDTIPDIKAPESLEIIRED